MFWHVLLILNVFFWGVGGEGHHWHEHKPMLTYSAYKTPAYKSRQHGGFLVLLDGTPKLGNTVNLYEIRKGEI